MSETHWDEANILFLLKLSFIDLSTIHGSYLQSLPWCLPNSFCMPFISSTSINRKSFVKEWLLLHLFVFLITYLYRLGLMDIYFILFIIIPYSHLFGYTYCFRFDHWELLQFGKCVFQNDSLFFNHFLIFCTKTYSRIFLYFFFSISALDQPFLQRYGFFYWRKMCRSQGLGTRYVHCYWSLLSSTNTQWTELENVMYV